ncbi:WD repeat-containing protein 62 isoform X2 [Lepisosteus oculatus]|uniref:WD repeat-containing protein 62 isoform X2 n=1 Tax=Lepisosteus oculatus TaxID=7918 RepID=UPI0037102360
MAEGAARGGGLGSRVRKLLGSPPALSLRRRSRQPPARRSVLGRVTLEKVLGITTSGASGLACDPSSGLVAYPAGCVVVLLHPKRNKQSHILNTSRKTFTALAFSRDGKYLVTGECGHVPCVRVWDVAERTQVAEVQHHKYGVACVAFSTNGSYIVSVGYEHDMTVNVWEWRKGSVIASNKVSSRVTSVSFSEDSSYFVTAGNRHVKFWYLDASKERRVNGTVPLIGRSGLLGEQRNRLFCDVACGRGQMAASTFCLTSSGLLCQFNEKRLLDSWIDLKTSAGSCLAVSEQLVFCGCTDGTVRVFNPCTLDYITTLPRPHCLGVDVAKGIAPGHLFSWHPEAVYPDTVALTYDPVTCWLTCVYSDHSVYVWDVRDVRKVGKVSSALYHSACVWSVETYPELEDSSSGCLPPGSFLTCSSDNTIRLWHCDTGPPRPHLTGYRRNLYSHDLLKIVYAGNSVQHLKDGPERGEVNGADSKAGIRVLGISPDGQHLASGDRGGNLSIYSLQFLDEVVKVEAHDSEVLCLEYYSPEPGTTLLASASRDRLIHVLSAESDYSLEQTLDDHSASITAVKFTGALPELRVVSCGADKSIYFRTAEKTSEGLSFSRSHHVVEKATLYDMALDATRTHAAIGCQDRNVRVYDVRSGKLSRCFKGSLSDEGTVLKVQMDPSGMFLATSCSDKNICIFDFYSGECVATVFGHSEIVTGMRFSQDCRHLITVAGDSCVFVWRLDSQMTNSMRKRLAEVRRASRSEGAPNTSAEANFIRRQTYITVPSSQPAQTGEEGETEEDEQEEECLQTPARDTSDPGFVDPAFLQTNGRLPLWAKRLGAAESCAEEPPERLPGSPYQPRGRWAEQSDPQALRSVLATRLQLPLSPSPPREQGPASGGPDPEDTDFQPQSLDSLIGEEEEVSEGQFVAGFRRPGFPQLLESEETFPADPDLPETSDDILYPANSTALSTVADSDFDVKELCRGGGVRRRPVEHSPDSACCVGSAESQASSQDRPGDDADSLSQASSTGSSGVDEEEEEEETSPSLAMTPEQETLLHRHFGTLADDLANEKFDTDLRDLRPSAESIFLNPRLSISARFLSRCQARSRLGAALPPRPFAPHAGISEEEPSDGTLSQERIAPEVGCECHPDQSEASSRGGNSSRAVQRKSSDRRRQRPPQCRRTISGPLLGVGPGDDGPARGPQAGAQPCSREDAEPGVATAAPRRQSLPGPCKEAAPAAAARAPWQSYMGATASSRAKMSRCSSLGENLNFKAAEDQGVPCKGAGTRASSALDLAKENLPPAGHPPAGARPPPGNHRARAGLRLDLAPAAPAPPPRRHSLDTPRPAALVTPTEMRSLGKEGKSYLDSVEESLQSQACSPARSWASLGPVARLQSHAGGSRAPTPVPEPLRTEPETETPTEGSRAPDTDTGSCQEPVSLQACQRVVKELQQALKKAVSLYCQLAAGGAEQQMKSVLADAFSAVQTELEAVRGPAQATPSPSRQLQDARTQALLERYSEQLLRMTARKLDCS